MPAVNKLLFVLSLKKNKHFFNYCRRNKKNDFFFWGGGGAVVIW